MATPGPAPDPIPPAQVPGRCAAELPAAAARIVGPPLVVDLDRPAPPEVVGAAAAAVRRGDRTVVGVCTSAPNPALAQLVSALDVTVVPRSAAYGRELVGVADPRAEAAALHAAAARHP